MYRAYDGTIITMRKTYAYNIAVAILLLFIVFIHLFMLGSVPRGIMADEMGMAYDAWSIGNFGVDRYLNSFPLYLSNFGGGQSALYCYLDIPFIMLGGITATMIRMPAFIFSMLTCICGFRIVNRTLSRRAGIIYLAIFALVPYFTMAGRIGLDCNLMLGACVLMLDLLTKAMDVTLEESSRGRLYLAAGITAGMVFYTYALSYVILPLLLILYFSYLFWLRRIKIKDLLRFAIPMVILALPLVIIQVINIFDLPVLHLGPFTLTKLPAYRGGEFTVHAVFEDMRWLWISIFGVDTTEFDEFKYFSTLYPVSIILIVAGIVIAVISTIRSVKRREYDFKTVILMYCFSICLVSLFITGVTTYRINALFFGLAYLMVIPLDKAKHKLTLWIAGGIYAICFIFFIHYYLVDYPHDIYPQRLFAEDMSPAIEYLEQQPDEVKNRLTCVIGVDEGYVYYLAATHTSPYDYDVNTYGNNGDGTYESGGVIFYTTEPFRTDCNYILYATDDETLDKYKELGFDVSERGAYWVVVD